MALTTLAINRAAPREKSWKLSDEKGLYLLIYPSGSKHWHFKYRYLGREKKLSFGAYPEVSLKDARAKRDEARALLADGRDPSQERKAARLAARMAAASTFGAIAREFIEKREHDGLAESTISKAKWLLSLLERSLGSVPIAEISTPM